MGPRDEENPASAEDEIEAEKEKLRPNPPEEMEMTKIPIKTKDGHYPEVIAGHDEPLIKSSHLKYLLIGFNFFIMLLGLILLIITIWILVDPEFWEYETTLDVDNFHTVCAMLIVASLFLIFVGFLGCLGSATERRWMLLVYMGLFGILFLLQLAAVAIMWAAPYSKKITNELERQINNQIKSSIEDDSSRYFMDFIQIHLKCCGAKSVDDYFPNQSPPSCFDRRSGSTFSEGCATKMLTYLRTKAGIVGGIAIPILLIQLLALLAAGCLINNLKLESRYFM